MKKNIEIKHLKIAGVVIALCAAAAIPVYAGTWIHGKNTTESRNGISSWWYQNADGSYLRNQWVWLDGNQDGVSECYCFDQNGYLYVSTTIDGYTVNADGAWTVNGVVQTRINSVSNTPDSAGQGQAVTGNNGTQTSAITSQQAAQIVAERIPGIQTSAIYVKKDYDDGRLQYEGEAYYNQSKYEFEIDAASGTFTGWEVESIYD